MINKSFIKFAIAALFAASTSTQATPLDLMLLTSPDIFSSGINTTYTASTDVFNAIGIASSVENDGAPPADVISGGTFQLTATIFNDGSLGGGSLTIDGNGGTLLTGSLIDFGFNAAGGNHPFEFLFDVTGGDLAPLYGSTGAIILNFTGFSGSFNADFENDLFAGNSDTGVIPVPPAVWLFGSGLLTLLGVKRRQSVG